MNKLILIFILSITICSCTQNNKVFSEDEVMYGNNGNVYEKNSKNKIEGTVIEKYDTGNIQTITEYKNGLRNGITKGFYENGNLQYEEYFSEGMLNGISKSYYKNGKLSQVCYFKNSEMDGVLKQFYENGNLEKIVNMKEGVPDGKCKYFYPNGKLKLDGEFKNGKMNEKTLKAYDQNGNRVTNNIKYMYSNFAD